MRATSRPRRTLARLGRPRALVAAAVWASLMAPRLAQACSVCFGDPNSPQTQGANQAILFLLIVTGGVLAAMAAFFICLLRRSRLAGIAGGDASGGESQRGAAGAGVLVDSVSRDKEDPA